VTATATFGVAAGGLRFTARAAGPAGGRLVLLLHGFPQTSLLWRHQLAALGRAGFRAVAVDQRGYSPGARPAAVEDYAAPLLAGDVLAVAGALGADRVDLIGHDWGAAVAWGLAAAVPDRVRSLAAVSVPHPAAFATAVLDDPDQARRSAYIAAFRRPGLVEEALLDGGGAGLRALFASTGLPATADAAAAVEEYVAVLSVPGALTAALNWYRANDLDGAGLIGPVAVPTLYLWGDADVAVGPVAAAGCAAHVTGPYRFEALAGVGHWAPEEAPQVVSACLLEHLAGTG